MIASVNPLPEWGHGWTRKMTPSIPIFRNEINALEDFRGGVKVARDFAPYSQPTHKIPLGFVEGFNNKIRVLQCRAYGLRDEEYLKLKILTSGWSAL